ncbi:short-chain dehydrogenase/reductase [Comamonas serinivorans]|uniref:Short-chain dehydrogenase/reductase n=1 Tax=Comamonas serinivorans TaxID=1082851 RepID=A0A1Y0ER65_9BURK|nr:oxidoreductase [Comamonas serinivorans]ARU05742.1 short-chain dehydrogenase/reductase [Comamonas serinivorans]
MTTQAPVWFISGSTAGFGLALVHCALRHGLRVVATGRHLTTRDVGLTPGDRLLLLDLDVSEPAQIQAAVGAALAHFGRIDVLVNNAGYGYQSSVEEGDDDAIRQQFEVNCFGLFALTRAVLPHLRAQRAGHIVNVTSVAGFIGSPGMGYYAASKHAVEGWSDALAAEVRPLGIHVTCVAPGPFRTDWAGRSLAVTPSAIADYRDTAAARMALTAQRAGHQDGDPEKAVEAIVQAVQSAQPPHHLLLGGTSVSLVKQRLERSLAEIEQWRGVSEATDFTD